MAKDTDDIVNVNPRKPLATTSEITGDSQSEGREHTRKSPSRVTEHDSDAYLRDTLTQVARAVRFPFPLHTDLTQKPLPGRRPLIKYFIASIAIEADSRGSYQHLWAHCGSIDACDQVAGARDTRLTNPPFQLRGPTPAGYRLAREVDYSVGAFQRVYRGRPAEWVPLERPEADIFARVPRQDSDGVSFVS
jgi:hypothetical protein